VNGYPTAYRAVDSAIGTPRIEIDAPAATQFNVRIAWKGAAPEPIPPERIAAIGRSIKVPVEPALLISIADPQQVLTNVRKSPSSFEADVTGIAGHRTVFAQVRQAHLIWWVPVDLELRPPIEILASAEQNAGMLSFRVRNNTQQPVLGTVGIAGADASNQQHIQLPQLSQSVQISLPAGGQLPGTTLIRATFDNGASAEAPVTNWNMHAAGAHWEEVDLSGEFNDCVGQIFRNHYLSPRSPYVSLSIPEQGIGGWSANKMTADIDDSGLRSATRKENGVFTMPQGVPFRTPDQPGAKNILFTSQWDNYPHQKTIPLSGRAGHVYLLMAGSTNPMQSRMENGEVVVKYADGTNARLPLRNPETWWPIEQDYLIDDYQFPDDAPLPPRMDLKTGKTRIPSRGAGEQVEGGSATVLDLPLDPVKELRSLTVRTLANEVVIGVMSVTLAR
jgi:hypothetical protein